MARLPKGLFFCLCLAVLLMAVGPPVFARVAEKNLHEVIAATALDDEHYLYSLDFLWFENLAEGELTLEKTERPHILRAELIGRTLGLAAWLSGDRTQRYTAFMEKQPDGSLRSLSFHSQVIKRRFGKWHSRRKRFSFEAEAHRILLEKAEQGTFRKSREFFIPAGQFPVDVLTGFYNLRSGVYGELHPGTRLAVPTVSSKGLSQIGVEVLTADQARKFSKFPEGGLLLRVTLDPEIFETTSGGMYLWFNSTGVPARGILEDVIGLGDVRGHLQGDGKP